MFALKSMSMKLSGERLSEFQSVRKGNLASSMVFRKVFASSDTRKSYQSDVEEGLLDTGRRSLK